MNSIHPLTERGQRPSDAPNRTPVLLRLLRDHRRLEQHQRNLGHARRWVEATDVALHRAQLHIDTVLGSLNRSSDHGDSELESTTTSLRAVMNAGIDQRLLFAGTAIAAVAFDDQGVYQGNDLPVLHQLTDDIVVPFGFTGSQVFLADSSRPANTLLTTLSELRACPEAGDPELAHRRSQLAQETGQIGEKVRRAVEQLQRQRNRLADLDASTSEAMVAVYSQWIEAHGRIDADDVNDRTSEASVDATLQATDRALANSMAEFFGYPPGSSTRSRWTS
ncbi:MAG: hypothetical protein O3C27_14365 [Actinomycetota bacterium]|nr:hypothetical protein [Actinomycetota bacterium]